MESKFGSKVHIMDHPLVAHKLTIMRDKNTSVKDFRELVSEIGMLITYEATRDLPLTTKHIETPICEMDAPTLAGRKFVVVPILRAGLGLVDGVLRMVPSARSAETTMPSRRAWSWPAPASTSVLKTAGPVSKTTR